MAAMRTRYPAGISRNTVLLAFASLFADISSEMLYPILPIFLTQVLHASGSVVGLVEGHVRDLRTGVEHEPGTRVQTCISAASGDCALDV